MERCLQRGYAVAGRSIVGVCFEKPTHCKAVIGILKKTFS